MRSSAADTARVFVAIELEAPLREAIGDLQARLRPRLGAVRPRPLPARRTLALCLALTLIGLSLAPIGLGASPGLPPTGTITVLAPRFEDARRARQ